MEVKNSKTSILSRQDFSAGFAALKLGADTPVLVHSRLKSFGFIRGAQQSVLTALLDSYSKIMMPAYTFQCMVVPSSGPPNNAISYRQTDEPSTNAELFNVETAVDETVDDLAGVFLNQEGVKRSKHPLLSFAARGLDQALEAQNLEFPFAPVEEMVKMEAWVLYIGASHRENAVFPYAEFLAGRKQFVRWALTSSGIKTCPGFPGCSEGYGQIAFLFEGITRSVKVGDAWLHALPAKVIAEKTVSYLRKFPDAALCHVSQCDFCRAIEA